MVGVTGIGGGTAGFPGPPWARFDEAVAAVAARRQARLTKPAGALGRLEALAVWLAGWQGRATPTLARPYLLLFTGWHGIAAARAVSAYPAEVTGQMLANFRAGGAAVNQLARCLDIELTVEAVREGVATRPFDEAPAMDEAVALAAFAQGRAAVPQNADLLLLGEMGIGNTTAAAAIMALLTGLPAELWAGPGTGLDAEGVGRKVAVIEAARRRVGCTLGSAHADPWRVLLEVGGHEIAALAGALAEARRRGLPVLLDGYVVGAAAALLHAADADAIAHCEAGHLSAEPAHARQLRHLGRTPLLDLGLRLGEGSGAALAVPLVRAALACHAGMATFDEAGVAGAGPG